MDSLITVGPRWSRSSSCTVELHCALLWKCCQWVLMDSRADSRHAAQLFRNARTTLAYKLGCNNGFTLIILCLLLLKAKIVIDTELQALICRYVTCRWNQNLHNWSPVILGTLLPFFQTPVWNSARCYLYHYLYCAHINGKLFCKNTSLWNKIISIN